MKVYHGGLVEIEKIDLSQSRLNRDFGTGFYVTNIQEQAEFWAKRKGQRHATKGYVTEFTFYENAYEHYELKSLRFDGYTEDWLDFVVLNRNPEVAEPAHEYDIVEGPVADDDITQRIDAYFESKTYKQLIDEKTELCNKSWEEIYKLLLTELDLKK